MGGSSGGGGSGGSSRGGFSGNKAAGQGSRSGQGVSSGGGGAGGGRGGPSGNKAAGQGSRSGQGVSSGGGGAGGGTSVRASARASYSGNKAAGQGTRSGQGISSGGGGAGGGVRGEASASGFSGNKAAGQGSRSGQGISSGGGGAGGGVRGEARASGFNTPTETAREAAIRSSGQRVSSGGAGSAIAESAREAAIRRAGQAVGRSGPSGNKAAGQGTRSGQGISSGGGGAGGGFGPSVAAQAEEQGIAATIKSIYGLASSFSLTGMLTGAIQASIARSRGRAIQAKGMEEPGFTNRERAIARQGHSMGGYDRADGGDNPRTGRPSVGEEGYVAPTTTRTPTGGTPAPTVREPTTSSGGSPGSTTHQQGRQAVQEAKDSVDNLISQIDRRTENLNVNGPDIGLPPPPVLPGPQTVTLPSLRAREQTIESPGQRNPAESTAERDRRVATTRDVSLEPQRNTLLNQTQARRTGNQGVARRGRGLLGISNTPTSSLLGG